MRKQSAASQMPSAHRNLASAAAFTVQPDSPVDAASTDFSQPQ